MSSQSTAAAAAAPGWDSLTMVVWVVMNIPPRDSASIRLPSGYRSCRVAAIDGARTNDRRGHRPYIRDYESSEPAPAIAGAGGRAIPSSTVAMSTIALLGSGVSSTTLE